MGDVMEAGNQEHGNRCVMLMDMQVLVAFNKDMQSEPGGSTGVI